MQKSGDGMNRAAVLKELRSGKLSTASAFQARFGRATSIRESSEGPVMYYRDAELLVTFPAKGSPRFQMIRVFPDSQGKNINIPVEVEEEFALGRLNFQ
jgi:hypothetical protein